jgi:hypothetical protein
MQPHDIQRYFTRTDGTYLFARWGRPLAPIAFGIDDTTLSTLKGAIEAIAKMVGHGVAETDPELGSNMMFFFMRDWSEVLDVPDMDKLVPDLKPLVEKLSRAGANQYRLFRFDETGAIKAVFVFLRMDAQLSQLPAEDLCFIQVVKSFLLWSDRAFDDMSPLAKTEAGHTILRPDIANVIRAAYDPTLDAMNQDPSHALRLFARVGRV